MLHGSLRKTRCIYSWEKLNCGSQFYLNIFAISKYLESQYHHTSQKIPFFHQRQSSLHSGVSPDMSWAGPRLQITCSSGKFVNRKSKQLFFRDQKFPADSTIATTAPTRPPLISNMNSATTSSLLGQSFSSINGERKYGLPWRLCCCGIYRTIRCSSSLLGTSIFRISVPQGLNFSQAGIGLQKKWNL